jgi:hypothetical protein
VALCTFAILALELGLIRWIGGQIRLVAYFANLILLAAFLGMGLGVAIGRTRPRLVHAALPAIAALSLVLAFSERLHLMRLRFPDPSIFSWGATGDAAGTLSEFAASTAVIIGLFWAVAGIFTLMATPLAALFRDLQPLRAYTADIAGSLAGIVAVTLVSARGAAPWEWIAVGTLPLLWFSRTFVSLAAAAAAILLAAQSGRGAFFSPYNRIDLAVEGAQARAGDPLRRNWSLSVNRDYHQHIADYSNEAVAADLKRGGGWAAHYQAVYEMPFRLRPGGTKGLVVGAGAGNDASAGVRAGFEVTAVEIDPTILRLGGMLHPEDPYANPRVHTVNDDARAFFHRSPPGSFDVVSYGFIDSHSMFSAMSSLRLDNFVYTVDGLRAGWAQVRDDGVMSVTFSTFAGPWIEQRLLRTLRDATGLTPMTIHHGLDYGTSFVVSKSIDTTLLAKSLRARADLTPEFNEAIKLPTDDWPFLYLRPGTVPYGYIVVLLIIAITAAVSVRRVFRTSSAGLPGFDAPMFLMGAGFMLLETRMVTELGLLFGSTWIVNSCVFGGILCTVLAANLWVERRPPASVLPWFAPLIAALVVTGLIGAGALNALDVALRGVVGGLVFALPVGFAGVIVATLLSRSSQPAVALGSNLIGAVLGGLLEYSSMLFGLRFVLFLAVGCYVSAFVLLRSARTATATSYH